MTSDMRMQGRDVSVVQNLSSNEKPKRQRPESEPNEVFTAGTIHLQNTEGRKRKRMEKMR